MNEENLKQKSISNFMWKFMERILAQLVSTIVSVVLARILLPDDYGIVAIVTIFIGICNVFISQGFATALIQKKDADDKDFSSMFFASIVLSVFLYIVLFFAAPIISIFFGKGYELLTPILRVMGLQIPISAVKSIQQAYVARKLMFKKFFWSTLGGTLFSAFVGILLAIKGAGAWALAGQYLTNTIIDTLILTITVKWRPIAYFSWKRITGMLAFGSKMLVAGLIDEIYTQLRSFVIGKKYSSADLAFYNKGNQFPALFINNINASLMAVLFPVMSRYQDSEAGLLNVCRKTIKISTFVIFPIMAGLAAISESFISILLTDKWLDSVRYMQIFCAIYAFYPIYTANLQGIKAVGNSTAYLWTEFSKKIVGLLCLIIAIPYGATWIALSLLISTSINYVINAISAKIVLKYPIRQQITDIAPNIIITGIMFATTYSINGIAISRFIKLLIQLVVGISSYCLVAVISKNESYIFILNTIKECLNRRCNCERN